MHYALYAPCTLHFAHAPCALHFAHAPCTCTTCRLAPLHLEPCTLTLHTAHTHSSLHMPRGGELFLMMHLLQKRVFFVSSYGSAVFRMLFWSSCLGISARRMQLRAWAPWTTVCCRTIMFFVDSKSNAYLTTSLCMTMNTDFNCDAIKLC